jgi:ABC-type multidrug transport system ATPase subunit
MSIYPKEDNFINSPSGARGMEIQLEQAGKRFNRDWIFRKLTYTFQQGSTYAITGVNGSGKSTLLQSIAGSTNISEGKVLYFLGGESQKLEVRRQESEERREKIEDRIQKTEDRSLKSEDREPKTDDGTEQSAIANLKSEISNQKSAISSEDIYQHISITAPYLELIEEMSVTEFLQFHASFKPLMLSIPEIISIIGLEKAAQKQMRYYSSGMKQRVKLAQAVFSTAPILLLDEPCTNLDKNGFELYHQLIENYCSNKLVIVCSNDENEMDFCLNRLSIADYK